MFCALSVVVCLHACNTHAQHKILVFYLQAFFFSSVDLESVEEGRSPVPLSALDTVALAAHYSFLLASVSKLPGRRPQVRVSARGPLRAWPRGVQLAGGNSVLCFAADVGGGEEWQLCRLNLCGPCSSVSPLAPSFEPMVPEIDLFIMTIF